jgi:hypothetical protein
MLERIDMPDAQSLSAGDVGEISQAIAESWEVHRLRARVAALEAAMRVDIVCANSACAARDCAAWISRGKWCDNCPCTEVSESARTLGIELAMTQKLSASA